MMDIVRTWHAFVKRMSARRVASGISLTLQTSGDTIHLGGEAAGALLLKGGVVTQYIETLTVRLQEYRSSGDTSAWETLSEVVIDAYRDLAPGETQEYAYQLSVPLKAQLSSNVTSAQVTVQATIRQAMKERRNVYVIVTPAPEIMAFDTALKQLGFAPYQFNFVATSPLNSGVVMRTYSVPEALSAQITNVTLQLTFAARYIHGHLMLNHVKVGLKERLRGAKREGRQFLPITIPCATLAGDAGAEEARAVVQNLLNQALILPDNQANWMLRASNSPPDAGNTLLRAAASTQETRPDQLLHPSEPSSP